MSNGLGYDGCVDRFRLVRLTTSSPVIDGWMVQTNW